ncbi:4-hydroxybenzoyl-CoA thioesterase [Steroidobacter denitrificans]|uniref:4-hydroxybenzoyl-CoA thioesterase n=1 Tax=Steroidobacter denitrificans TaxID=465721 RepID=A0A127FC14_STEDE|nr:tol-pal system-associated acyl-CoA thioesterase [Steroidobacter denitrificans]AMN47155.1 4-hydroxybenzoyl-CoA thioesterase [Steroidobacter denitrificans]
MNPVFVWPVRVYYEDVDLGGIVYYANYMKFMERARTEWLRAAGIDQLPLKEQHGLIFAVVELQTRFRKPARFDDVLQVSCAVVATARASLTLKQEIHREGPHGELLLDGDVRIACLDVQTLRPRPLPPQLASRFNLAGVE